MRTHIIHTLVLSIIFSGCSILAKDDAKIDTPKEVESAANKSEESTEQRPNWLKRTLFGAGKKEAEVKQPVVDPKVEEMYNDALDHLKNRRFDKAIKGFQDVERIYPFEVWSKRATIMEAYSQYKARYYEDAVATVDGFIALNPAHEDIGYLYYLKALSYYDRISDVKRDQDITLKALAALSDVQRRFPATVYANDAKIKKDLVRDHLAGKEMEIGRFYLTRKNYVGAINRFKIVVEKYDNTSHAPEALYRLTEAYSALGVTAEAKKYAAVLGYNAPATKWYAYAYKLVQLNQDAPKPRLGEKWYKKASPLRKRSVMNDDGTIDTQRQPETIWQVMTSWF